MAVSEGARCCGLDDCDCLAEGKLADLVMIDLHRPNMQPENNLVKNLVYSGSKQNVKLTMVAGKNSNPPMAANNNPTTMPAL